MMYGSLRLVRDKVQPKLNNFREYTILNAGPFAEFTGFTSEEDEKQKTSLPVADLNHFDEEYGRENQAGSLPG